ncbi:MAG: class II aldolase/adducin family protein [Verrucomicrobiota bacterium]
MRRLGPGRAGSAVLWNHPGGLLIAAKSLHSLAHAPGNPIRYEAHTGDVIMGSSRTGSAQHPAVLVASHGPFTWGGDVAGAVRNAVVLEFVARLASETLRINPGLPPMQAALLDKHFLRKHGPGAYYGQSAGQP